MKKQTLKAGSCAAPGSANHWWAVAVVLLKSGHQGVVKMILRHGLWLSDSKDEAIGAAVLEALEENPGWTIHLVNATEMPPNAGGMARELAAQDSDNLNDING